MIYQYKMRGGMKLDRSPNHPILSVIGDGKRTYLWVGNDAKDDMACFATLGGAANLRRVAHAILKVLGSS